MKPYRKKILSILFAIFGLNQVVVANSSELVVGRNFSVPVTQSIRFVPLRKIDPKLFVDKNIPKKIDLHDIQSKVKSQGARGACTYFVVTGLVESLIKKSTGQEVDLSEEYLAWAAKAKKKLRVRDEDSSVAVNAATVQDFGLMFEKDLPYQQSWFDKGNPCSDMKSRAQIEPRCYSHDGPNPEQKDKIMSGNFLEFRDIGSSSIDVVREMAQSGNPVAVSILAHPKMWDETKKTGALFLDKKSKRECQRRPGLCTGHAALITGYDLNLKVFYFKNSWGEDWGLNGYGTIPFSYIDQMSDRKFLTGRLIAKWPAVN